VSVRRSCPNRLPAGWRLGGRAPAPNLYYRFMRRLCQVTMCLMWKVRVFDRHHEPAEGGAVYLCNHQSFLDPMLMSFALRRPMNYMARDSLFRFPVFKQIIRSLNAFPVRRGKADVGALKEAMRRLKSGGQVVIFPEGTRTHDGRIGPFLPGAAVLCQRAAEWTVPVVIDGAFEAWPRTAPLPAPGSVIVQYAPPIPRAEARKQAPEEFVEGIRQQIIEMQADVRRRAGRPAINYSYRG